MRTGNSTARRMTSLIQELHNITRQPGSSRLFTSLWWRERGADLKLSPHSCKMAADVPAITSSHDYIQGKKGKWKEMGLPELTEMNQD